MGCVDVSVGVVCSGDVVSLKVHFKNLQQVKTVVYGPMRSNEIHSILRQYTIAVTINYRISGRNVLEGAVVLMLLCT